MSDRSVTVMRGAPFIALAISLALIEPWLLVTFLPFAFTTSFLISLCVEKRFVAEAQVGACILFYVAVGIYAAQYLALPEYYGFSGGLGIGTDDSYFYSLAAPTLPDDFPVRGDYADREHEYAYILEPIALSVYELTGRLHPLDLVFLNVSVLAFAPIYVRRIVRLVGAPSAAQRFAYWATLLCPLLLSNGAILVRDGMIATFVVLSISYALELRRIPALIGLLAVAWLRVEAGVLLAAMIGAVLVLRKVDSICYVQRLIGRVSPGLLAGAIVSFAAFLIGTSVVLSAGFGEGGWFRQDYVSFIASGSDSHPGSFASLLELPGFLRTPVTFAFYFGAPFVSPDEIWRQGLVVPRQILANVFAVIFPFYLYLFVKAVFRAFSDKDLKLILLVVLYCVAILVLSQASLQLRHKVMVLPLFYAICGSGWGYSCCRAEIVAKFAVVAALLANVTVNSIELLSA